MKPPQNKSYSVAVLYYKTATFFSRDFLPHIHAGTYMLGHTYYILLLLFK